MNVVIDVGNTRMKYAFFEMDCLKESGFGWERLETALMGWKQKGEPIYVLLSGSGNIPEKYIVALREWADFFLEASSAIPMPLKIDYLTPNTLGFDRIANCVGAMKLFPDRPLLVIDSGTCITYNYVDAHGVFLGGNISPGVEIRFNALHHYTAKLPCLKPVQKYGGIGRTTEEAIQNGVLSGMFFEVQTYVERFYHAESNGMVVVTGGNADFLRDKGMEQIYFCDVLGFLGLNEVLQYAKSVSKC